MRGRYRASGLSRANCGRASSLPRFAANNVDIKAAVEDADMPTAPFAALNHGGNGLFAITRDIFCCCCVLC